MLECPVSFSSLFQLLVAVEGLSLWSAFNVLPNTWKRIDLKATFDELWKKESVGLSKGQKNQLYAENAVFVAKMTSWDWQVRVYKIIPNVVLIAMLLLYVAFPALVGHSVTGLLACWWRPLCFAILLFVAGRVIWFIKLVFFSREVESKFGSLNVPFDKTFNLSDFFQIR